MEKVEKGLTFIIATKNQGANIEDAVGRCANQNYKGKIEIIVSDDNSTDGTQKIVERIAKTNSRIKYFNTKGTGRVKGLNWAISSAKTEFICLSAGDIFYEKDFAKTIISYFKDNKTAFVSPFSETGGNATVWRREVLDELKGFDEEFNEKGTGFRDDTDLAFRAFDKGYNGIFTYKTAKFKHEHSLQKNDLINKIKYGFARLKIHRFDPLLYKKHPERAKNFFDIKIGFIRNPLKDFEAATGLWKGKFDFSSPQGVVLLKGNSFPKKIAIIPLGICYVICVKVVRLYGSIKYGKLLI
ncbi:MAG: glycosyltransferase family A protein [Candidatus Diapherotrites archaeon]|nr:glycosyltransferase family A protein [Candidatus Diapherotrites archaeon]